MEGEGEAKKCETTQRSFRHGVGNGGDLGGKRNKRIQEMVGLVATDDEI